MIRGSELHEIQLYYWDNDAGDWSEESDETIFGYAGQGYQEPTDSWINRPTGTETYGGMVFLLPRSVEIDIPPPQVSGLWTLREC